MGAPWCHGCCCDCWQVRSCHLKMCKGFILFRCQGWEFIMKSNAGRPLANMQEFDNFDVMERNVSEYFENAGRPLVWRTPWTTPGWARCTTTSTTIPGSLAAPSTRCSFKLIFSNFVIIFFCLNLKQHCWWLGTCGPEEDDAHGKESLKKIECFNK